MILKNNVGGFQSFWVKADIDGYVRTLKSSTIDSKSLCLQTCTNYIDRFQPCTNLPFHCIVDSVSFPWQKYLSHDFHACHQAAPRIVFQPGTSPHSSCVFQHLNFQKWSDAEVFCTFSLRNRLRATTACNFSSLISPDVSAPAALASLLFNPPEPQNHEKTQCFATFLPFRAPASSFFWSFLVFWLFSLLTAFSSLHIVGSLTSKLPSIVRFTSPFHYPSLLIPSFSTQKKGAAAWKIRARNAQWESNGGHGVDGMGIFGDGSKPMKLSYLGE